MKIKYRKNVQIVLVDLAAIIFSFLAASKIRYSYITEHWFSSLYNMGFVMTILIYLCIFFLNDTHSDIVQRGYLEELKIVIKTNCFLALGLLALIFIFQDGVLYSRVFYGIFIVINIFAMYLSHLYYKQFVEIFYESSVRKQKVMIVTDNEYANSKLKKYLEGLECNTEVICLCIVDEDLIGKKIHNIQVKSNKDTMFEYIRTNVVDEVFISTPSYTQEELQAVIQQFESLGVIVNVSVDTFGLKVMEKSIQDMGIYHVLTYSIKVFEPAELLLKRIIDIIGALVGLLLTGIISIFVAPAILIESRGPLIFSQTRIGKNGRRFKIYKFRSMYPDAEERKKELLAANEMSDENGANLMFKMTNDPRITKVGKFIRDTSIDELPQFLNVLKGEMSLVGTRPPTEDEFLQYDLRHKRRLSLKPGLTGMWQVSGRSNIDNFEDVVKLDLEYIDHWSVLMDIKILFKTVWVVLKRKGSK
ncbi:sugar transferase [Anaeromicropila herbilytica]|uniref:Galactosyl transferase CpsE n=1 Tax=Anaeromicropila herbilytica TaxID=2785025 RepID=A0A7R7ENT1_9FIRM|nr:sugar transferase [Anaeromicropila herbilytica]BCN32259.1 galactosyl transferase CpsE [Anaeromicropila herbilytica]